MIALVTFFFGGLCVHVISLKGKIYAKEQVRHLQLALENMSKQVDRLDRERKNYMPGVKYDPDRVIRELKEGLDGTKARVGGDCNHYGDANGNDGDQRGAGDRGVESRGY